MLGHTTKLVNKLFFASILLSGLYAQAQVFEVTNTNDSGTGSLRQAIISANSFIGSNPQIVFNIPFPATHTTADWQ